MIKKLGTFLVFLGFIVISCGTDDEDSFVNTPPTPVSDIEALSIQGTTVKVNWKPSEDANNDKISYDVVINEIIVANKTEDTFIEFDAVQFLENNKKLNTKGLNLQLVVQITAYDTNGGVSEQVEVNRMVFINRDPGEFSFVSINFDFDNYNWINFYWTPAIDEDGDILSYDIYFNETLVRKDYVIGSDSGLGEFNYIDIWRFLEEELVIKVIANDQSGGTREITETFNFRATDEDLGPLSVPYDNSFQFNLKLDEYDQRVGYTFSIDQETGYSLNTHSNVYFKLYTNDGQFINSGSREVSGEILPVGSYYLEVLNSQYNTQDINDTITIIFRDSNATDIDLGLLTIPYTESIPFEIQATEPDHKIKYKFRIDQELGYNISTDSEIDFRLYTSSGVYINSGDNEISNELLEPGTYYFIIKDNNSYIRDISGLISLNFIGYTATDVDLGLLSIPFENSVPFEIDNLEFDDKIRYTFTISQETGYSISTESDINIKLYNNTGINIQTGNSNITGESLSEDSYYFEITKTNNNNISGLLNILFKNVKDSDVNLGIIETPYFNSFQYTINAQEIDEKVGYTFEIEEETDYVFFNSDATTLRLYNDIGSLINEGYDTLSGKSLPVGSYYLEVTNDFNQAEEVEGYLTLSIRNFDATDLDLGTLTIPYEDSLPFKIETEEPDRVVRYTFNIIEDANYSFSTEEMVELYLYTDTGEYINGGSQEISGDLLSAGSYYLEFHDIILIPNIEGVVNIILQN